MGRRTLERPGRHALVITGLPPIPAQRAQVAGGPQSHSDAAATIVRGTRRPHGLRPRDSRHHGARVAGVGRRTDAPEAGYSGRQRRGTNCPRRSVLEHTLESSSPTPPSANITSPIWSRFDTRRAPKSMLTAPKIRANAGHQQSVELDAADNRFRGAKCGR